MRERRLRELEEREYERNSNYATQRRLAELEERENSKNSVWGKIGVVIGIIFLIVAIIGVILIFGVFTELGESNQLAEEQLSQSNDIIYIIEEKIIYIQEIINNFFNGSNVDTSEYEEKIQEGVNQYSNAILC